MEIKAIIIRGNGNSLATDNWFPYLDEELPKLGIKVIHKDFPDSDLAREEYWIPFITELGADEHTILIGHSTGAVAAMRYAENNKILGSILVGVCHTDLGIENEKISGYFNRPWNWKAIKNNQKWIIHFFSTDDPYIPIEETKHINKNLQTEYYEYNDAGHFGSDKTTFPKMIEIIKNKIS